MSAISNITPKELRFHPEKYIRIKIDTPYVNENFKELLEYIDKNFRPRHEENSNKNPYGYAYKEIRDRTNRRLGNPFGWVKTSKKEIRSILESFKSPKFVGETNKIKITYKINYIFATIIDIVEEIDEPLPLELKKFIGDLYGNIFYDEHIRQYKGYYDRFREQSTLPGNGLIERMNMELDVSTNSVLGTRIK